MCEKNVITNCSYLVRKYLCKDKNKWNDDEIEKINKVIIFLTDYGNAQNIYINEIKNGNKEITDMFLNLLKIKYFSKYKEKNFCSKLFLMTMNCTNIALELSELSKENNDIDAIVGKKVIKLLSVIDLIDSKPTKLKDIDEVLSKRDFNSNLQVRTSISSPIGNTNKVQFDYSREIMLFNKQGQSLIKSVDGYSHEYVLFYAFTDYFKNYFDENILKQNKNISRMGSILALDGVITILIECDKASVWVPSSINEKQYNSLTRKFGELALNNKKVSFYLWNCLDDKNKIFEKVNNVNLNIIGEDVNCGEELTYEEFIEEINNLKINNSIKK